jgi:transposase
VTSSEERKKRVIDLYYNQGKTTREIAKIERISIRDISAIIKEEETRRQKHKHQQQEGEVSSKAYKLFSEGKRPVEVAIALNLREQDATKLYREYWKLSDCIYSIQYSRDRWQIRDILEIIPADEGKRHEY